MKFVSDKPNLIVWNPATQSVAVRFTEGAFETTDDDLIALLKKTSGVTCLGGKPADSTPIPEAPPVEHCRGTTRGGKPCKGVARYDGFCVAHKPKDEPKE